MHPLERGDNMLKVGKDSEYNMLSRTLTLIR